MKSDIITAVQSITGGWNEELNVMSVGTEYAHTINWLWTEDAIDSSRRNNRVFKYPDSK